MRRNENGYGRLRTYQVNVRLSEKEYNELVTICEKRDKKWDISSLIRALIHDEFLVKRHAK